MMSAVKSNSNAGKGPATEDYQPAIMLMAAEAKKDYDRRAEIMMRLASTYVPPDLIPTNAFSDQVHEADFVFVPLGWEVFLQEGFQAHWVTISVTYETVAAYKVVVSRIEREPVYHDNNRQSIEEYVTTSYFWLPKSQVAVGQAFGLPVLRVPKWLAKKYPILLRMAAKTLANLAGVSD
jgi:hypothetical protein